MRQTSTSGSFKALLTTQFIGTFVDNLLNPDIANKLNQHLIRLISYVIEESGRILLGYKALKNARHITEDMPALLSFNGDGNA